MAEATALPFDWADPFALDAQLSDEERLVRDTAEGYAQERLQPRVTQAYLEENFERDTRHRAGPALSCEMPVPGCELPRQPFGHFGRRT